MAADKPQSLAELLQTFLESNPSVPRADRATTELEVKFGTMGVRPVTRIRVCRSTPQGSNAVNFANWRFGEKRSWFVYLSAVIGRAL